MIPPAVAISTKIIKYSYVAKDNFVSTLIVNKYYILFCIKYIFYVMKMLKKFAEYKSKCAMPKCI